MRQGGLLKCYFCIRQWGSQLGHHLQCIWSWGLWWWPAVCAAAAGPCSAGRVRCSSAGGTAAPGQALPGGVWRVEAQHQREIQPGCQGHEDMAGDTGTVWTVHKVDIWHSTWPCRTLPSLAQVSSGQSWEHLWWQLPYPRLRLVVSPWSIHQGCHVPSCLLWLQEEDNISGIHWGIRVWLSLRGDNDCLFKPQKGL